MGPKARLPVPPWHCIQRTHVIYTVIRHQIKVSHNRCRELNKVHSSHVHDKALGMGQTRSESPTAVCMRLL